MARRPQCFSKAATLLETLRSKSIKSMVAFPIQGFASMTYEVIFTDDTTVVLQCRSRADPDHAECYHKARSILHDFAPSIELIGKDEDQNGNTVWFYEMSRIPGQSVSTLIRSPSLDIQINLANTSAELLALKMHIPGRFVDDEEVAVHSKWLEALCTSEDPTFVQDRVIFQRLLDNCLELKGLPLAIDNGDFSPTNVMTDDLGKISGVVDWESVAYLPLGFRFCFIIFITAFHKLFGRKASHTSEEDALQIERVFWRSIMKNFPTSVAKLPNIHRKLEVSFQFGYVLLATLMGRQPSPIFYNHITDYAGYRIPNLE
ncbi:hypothetical protein M422DRAFT_68920 [Sphaerobolus stellatus SS14]|uniref:Aminoglycoside phosphotransferase domain-containing protein n=1 Tax=Sphaerobolus stellatus (strain SS14) TaxID=990650 RepID=A0A0C9UW63_SPHS4|nr:hypothetical protein M422DRAFT_68920 [Sphaerobolus stellatus SS14]